MTPTCDFHYEVVAEGIPETPKDTIFDKFARGKKKNKHVRLTSAKSYFNLPCRDRVMAIMNFSGHHASFASDVIADEQAASRLAESDKAAARRKRCPRKGFRRSH